MKHTELMGKKIEELIVTLPMMDGTELQCGVFAYYEVEEKEYFALLPKLEDGSLDKSQSYMIYEVKLDEENNPIIIYIEDDREYAVAANYFADNYLDAE